MSRVHSNELTKKLKEAVGIGAEEARVLIVGLGDTGFSVARFFHRNKIQFAVTDSRERPPLYRRLLEEMPEIPIFLGGFNRSAIGAATHLIVSPGVSLDEPAISEYASRGGLILSDIDLFVCAIFDTPVAAITGSNGKSTVTTLVGEMAREAGLKAKTGGNLGTPALDLVEDGVQLYVLELSSFQLERTSLLNAAVAVVLNVTPDHMDRHRGMNGYAREKEKIYRGVGTMVINADDPIVCHMQRPDRDVVFFGLERTADFHVLHLDGEDWLARNGRPLMKAADLKLEGRHNLANALSALAMGSALGFPDEAMCRVLMRFGGLDHRMQKVAEIAGVVWINDSKATNVGASIAALSGYADKVVLIAGGDCKGADMREFGDAIRNKVKAAVLLGKDAKIIDSAIGGAVPVYFAESIENAVKIASGISRSGDTVLLSPACASLDQFTSYKERGQRFADAVRRLAA